MARISVGIVVPDGEYCEKRRNGKRCKMLVGFAYKERQCKVFPDIHLLIRGFKTLKCDGCIAAEVTEAESKENYYTMIEFRKAADMNCNRYLKLKRLLEEIKATHDKTDWAGCESVKYLQSCAYSEIISKITKMLEGEK